MSPGANVVGSVSVVVWWRGSLVIAVIGGSMGVDDGGGSLRCARINAATLSDAVGGSRRASGPASTSDGGVGPISMLEAGRGEAARAAASVAVQGEERGGAGRGACVPLRRSTGGGGASTAREGAWGGMRFFLLRRSLFLFLLYFLLAVQDIPCTRIYVATRTESRLQSQDTRRCNWRSIRTNRMRAAHFLRGGERPTCWRLRAAHARVDAGPPRMGVACFCRARGREVFLWSVQLLY